MRRWHGLCKKFRTSLSARPCSDQEAKITDRVLAKLLSSPWSGSWPSRPSRRADHPRDVSGTVRDATGAVVPGAAVTVTNTGPAYPNGGQRAQGFFRIPALEPGRYTVKAELTGFQSVERKASAGDAPAR